MATTHIKAAKQYKGYTRSKTIAMKIDYITNPEKTENGALVFGYECNPVTAHEEFIHSVREYERNVLYDNPDGGRLVYQIRQSFAPGEVDAKTAHEMAQELAMEFTKGRHAFVVATHTDTDHIHSHIIFNAVELEAERKFKDEYYSGKRIAEISDRLCKERGLSVIEKTKRRGAAYNLHKANQELEKVIRAALETKPKSLAELFKRLAEQGCEAKPRGKDISIKTPFCKSPIRASALSEALRNKISDLAPQALNVARGRVKDIER